MGVAVAVGGSGVGVAVAVGGAGVAVALGTGLSVGEAALGGGARVRGGLRGRRRRRGWLGRRARRGRRTRRRLARRRHRGGRRRQRGHQIGAHHQTLAVVLHVGEPVAGAGDQGDRRRGRLLVHREVVAGDALDLGHRVVEAPVLAEHLDRVAGAHAVQVAEDVAVAQAADVADEDAVADLARAGREDAVSHPEGGHLPGGGPELGDQAGGDDGRIEADPGQLHLRDRRLRQPVGQADGADLRGGRPGGQRRPRRRGGRDGGLAVGGGCRRRRFLRLRLGARRRRADVLGVGDGDVLLRAHLDQAAGWRIGHRGHRGLTRPGRALEGDGGGAGVEEAGGHGPRAHQEQAAAADDEQEIGEGRDEGRVDHSHERFRLVPRRRQMRSGVAVIGDPLRVRGA